MIRNCKRTKLWILLFTLVLVFSATICVLFVPNGQAAHAASVVSYDTYTDSDNLYGSYSNYQITQYPNQLHATKSRITTQGGQGSGFKWTDLDKDDPIVGIVPRELFSTVGDTIHIGTEYGFFINTKTVGANYTSTVLVFDIRTNTNLSSTIDQVIVSVVPIFEYQYAYLAAGSSNFMTCGFYMSYNISQNVIVPLPTYLENRTGYSKIEWGFSQK